MKNVHRSLAYAAADSYLGVALQLVSTIVLARILTPAQIGVFAIASVFTSLASNFRNFGITEYLIQERDLTDETIRAAFAVNIAVSWAMGLLLVALAPLLGKFYKTPAIEEVMYVQAASFALIPFGAITLAYFRRELLMRPVFIAGALANLTAFGVAISLALLDFGYMSLAWSGIAGVCVNVFVSMCFRPKNLPRWPALKGTKAAFQFGKHVSGIYVFGQLGNGAPEMIIGRTEGVVPVAYFSRANGLTELFNKLVLNAIWPIVLPIFAKRQREAGGLHDAYLAGVSYLTVVSWPIIFFMGIMAYPAVRIFYGPQWTESVYLAQILCIAVSLSIVYHLTTESLIARGEVENSNYLQMKVQGSRVVGLLAVIPFGLQGACWGLVMASVAGAYFCHQSLKRAIALTFGEVLSVCIPTLRITLIAAAPVALLTYFVPPSEDNYLRVGVGGGLLLMVFWVAAVKTAGHPIWNELSRITAGLGMRIDSAMSLFKRK